MVYITTDVHSFLLESSSIQPRATQVVLFVDLIRLLRQVTGLFAFFCHSLVNLQHLLATTSVVHILCRPLSVLTRWFTSKELCYGWLPSPAPRRPRISTQKYNNKEVSKAESPLLVRKYKSTIDISVRT